jgi:GTP cyclohydrolase I
MEGYGFRPRSGASTPTTGVPSTAYHPLVPRLTPATQSAWQDVDSSRQPEHSAVASSSTSRASKALGSRHEQEADMLDDMEESAGDLLGRGSSGFGDVEDRGYGFGRGGENPMTASEIADSEGLGWPAKLTHQRLHATPDQQAANLKRLSGAVRTVLECIGEDPDREGLERTPERYAKALLWMTKGYEERLSGECCGRRFYIDSDD